MRGDDRQQADMYSYLSPEQRVREDHPLRKIRAMADEAFEEHVRSGSTECTPRRGRPSIPPEKLLRDFHGEKRSNQTHQSTTDADALRAGKSNGKEAKLSYNGNLLTDNRNGLIVNTEVFQANGTAERDAALIMLEQIPGGKRVTVGADKAFDTKDFIAECRHVG